MKFHIAKATLVALMCVASTASAQSFTNGSLTGPVNTDGVPSGWTKLLNTPDTVDPTHNVGGVGNPFAATPSLSPDGGTWVGLGRDGTSFVERFGQTVSGLNSGQSYTVSWFASNFGYDLFGYTNPNQIEMFVGGNAVGAASLLSLGQGWFAQSLTFTAGSSAEEIGFQLGSGNKSYMGIDGIALSSSIAVVPEPATWMLLAAGLGLVGMAKRRRRA